ERQHRDRVHKRWPFFSPAFPEALKVLAKGIWPSCEHPLHGHAEISFHQFLFPVFLGRLGVCGSNAHAVALFVLGQVHASVRDTRTRTLSPTRCPWRSWTGLKLSRSIMITENGLPVRGERRHSASRASMK